MSAVDRMAEGYEPDFDIDSKVGHQGQLFVTDIIDALTNARGEVKTDEKALQTGNLFVEYECRGRDGKWRRSGIATTKTTYMAFVVGPLCLVIPVDVLKPIAREYLRLGKTRECTRGSNPTKGVVIPWKDLVVKVRGSERKAA